MNTKLRPEILKMSETDLNFTETDGPYEMAYLKELYSDIERLTPKINEAYERAKNIDADVPADLRRARQETLIAEQSGKLHDIGQKHTMRLQELADKELAQAQKIEIPDFDQNFHGPRAAEIRNHLWSLSMIERTQVLADAAKHGNEEIILAISEDPFKRTFLLKERFDQIKDAFYSQHRSDLMENAKRFQDLVPAAQHRIGIIIRSLNKVGKNGIA